MNIQTPEQCIAKSVALSRLAEERPEHSAAYLLMAEMWLRVSEVVERGELEKLAWLEGDGFLTARAGYR